MKEESIYWVGTQPLAIRETPDLRQNASFIAAIGSACESAGCVVRRFISALGPFGTWLVEIERNGEEQRILWNGKEKQLVLQVKLRQGGWEDPMTIEVATQDIDGFVDGIQVILAGNADHAS